MSINYFTILITIIPLILCDKHTKKTDPEGKFKAQLTIVNGNPATVGQIPYFVSIKEPMRKYDKIRVLWKNLCGGSIIGTNKVLTAAHCFEVYNNRYRNNPSLLRVVAGNIRNFIMYSGYNITEIDNQWRNITKLVVHNDFDFPKNDIAMLFVDDFLYSDYISYVKPARVNRDYYVPCQAIGFGMIGYANTEEISHVLLVANIDVMDRWKCSIFWDENMDTFVCSDSTHADVARGDSGGPLVCRGTTDPAEEPGRDLLVGIVSGKSFDRTTLYSRVSAHKDWIDRDSSTIASLNLYVLNICLITYYVYDI